MNTSKSFSVVFVAISLWILSSFNLAFGQGCECGNQVTAFYEGYLKGKLTITVGDSSMIIQGGSDYIWVKGEGMVFIPTEGEVPINFEFVDENPQQSGRGVGIRFGCSDNYEVKKGSTGPWLRTGTANESQNGNQWAVRRARPNAEGNVPGSGCGSNDDGGAMPEVAKPYVQDYSAHPAISAGMSINLGGAAGDLAFGGTLRSSGTFASRNNVRLYPATLDASKRSVYLLGGKVAEVLAKNGSGDAVAHIKLVDITNGYEIQVSLPGTTGATGPWTAGTRQVTYRITTDVSLTGFGYGARVKKLVGSNPASPTQTTETQYYGDLNVSLKTAKYEKHTLPVSGNVFVESYHSQIASNNRTETLKEEEIQGSTRVLGSKTVDVYRLGVQKQELLLNHKTYVDATNYLETVYTYHTDDRLKSRSNLATGDWSYYVYSFGALGPSLTTHEFGPWLGVPAAVPTSNPSTGSFAGRRRSKTEGYSATRQEWRPTIEQEFINNIVVSEVHYSYSDPYTTSVRRRTAAGALGSATSLVTTTTRYNSTSDWYHDLVEEVVYPDGSKTKYEYATTDTQEIVSTWNENSGGYGNKLSIREVRKTSKATGRLDRVETDAYIGGWKPATATDYTYHLDGRLDEVTKDGVTVEKHNYSLSGSFPKDRISETVDQFGVTITNEYDARGRLIKSTKHGTSGTLHTHPTMLPIITENVYTLSTNGHQVATRLINIFGNIVTETIEVTDLAGRIKSSTDEQGMTTTYAYTKNVSTGRSLVTQTLPGGTSGGTRTIITDTYPEGTLFGVYGTGTEASVNKYEVAAGNSLITTTFRGVTTVPGTTAGYRWQKTTLDLAGRVIQEQQPGVSGTIQKTYSYRNNAATGAGKVEFIDFTGDTVFGKIGYTYDFFGNQIGQWQDRNGSNGLDSNDPLTEVITIYDHEDPGDPETDVWRTTETKVYDNAASSGSSRVVRRVSSRVKALGTAFSEIHEYDYVGNGGAGVKTVTLTTAVNSSNKTYEVHRIRTNASSGAALGTAKELYVNGLMVGSSSETVSGNAYYRYNSMGQLWQTKDPRATNFTTITYYLNSEKNNAGAYVGKEKSISSPLGQVTSFTYYRNESWHSSPAGSLMTTTDPNAGTTHSWYDRWGRVTHQWGTNSYPVKYLYDTSDGTGTFDDLEEMQTYRSGSFTTLPTAGLPTGFGTTGDRTLWVYNGGSGLLVSKGDTNGSTQYAYISGTGLVSTISRPRTSASNFATTTFTYDGLGRVLTRTHNDGTPTVTYTYTRDGRLATVSDASGTHAITESATAATRLRTDVITGGVLNGFKLEDTVGIAGEQTKFAVKKVSGGTTETETVYDYDPSKNRLTTATETTGTDLVNNYTYVPNSDLINTVVLKKGTITKVTQTRTYNANKDRLLSISNTHTIAGGTVITSQAYPDANYDPLDRPKRVNNAEDGTFWEYVYNARGEVTSAILKRGTSPIVPLPGWSYNYSYDQIGNRTSVGGTSGTGTYYHNARNQITLVGNQNLYVVKGRAPTPSTPVITVDSVNRTVTKQTVGTYDYFKSDITTPSNPQPYYDQVTVTSGGDSGTWYKFAPPATDNRTYDFSGNLKTDWRWTYTWDANDRLIKMVTQATAVTGGVPNLTLDFVYDHMGRRVRKTVKLGAGVVLDTKFVYNGWNLVAEFNAASNTIVRRYLWGADLSGTLQGAGGVGGLLAIREGSTTTPIDQLVCIDGNGNVMALVDAGNDTSAAIKARYMYDAFGQKNRAYGVFAATNPFGFSSKYEDSETGLLYYGYRYYDPVGGRWLSRDPIGEEGGLNLYGFVGNNGVNGWDYLGLETPNYHEQRMVHARRAMQGGASRTASARSVRGKVAAASAAVIAGAIAYAALPPATFPNCTKAQTKEVIEGAKKLEALLKKNSAIYERSNKEEGKWRGFYHGSSFPSWNGDPQPNGGGDFGMGLYTFQLDKSASQPNSDGTIMSAYHAASQRANQKASRYNRENGCDCAFPFVLLFVMNEETYQGHNPLEYKGGKPWQDYVNRNRQTGGRLVDGNAIVSGPTATGSNTSGWRPNPRLPDQTRFGPKGMSGLFPVAVFPANYE